MSERAAQTLYDALMRKAGQVDELDFEGSHVRAHELRAKARDVASAKMVLRAADDLIRRHPKRKATIGS